MLDLEKGINRQLWLPTVEGSLVNLDWSNNGCQLYASFRTHTGVDILTLNLLGAQIDKVSFVDLANVYSNWTVSPTGTYLAYLEHSGTQSLYYSEFQDVRIVPTNNTEADPLVLTNQGWTLQPVWSSDGQQLAYSNFDSNGIAQLYYSSVNGSKVVQLTDFPKGTERIEVIQWSPNSKQLAFTVIKEGQVSLWSVNADTSNLQEANLGKFIPNSDLWWTDDSQVYTVLTQQWLENHPVSESKMIFWIDSLTGQVISQLPLSSQEETKTEVVFPAVTGDTIGFLGRQITLYNSFTESLIALTQNPFTESSRLTSPFPLIVPGPMQFSGEIMCGTG